MSILDNPEPVVTLDEFRALTNGSEYIVKIRDIDGVWEKARGKELRFTFTYIELAGEFRDDPPEGSESDVRYWMVLGMGRNGEDLPDWVDKEPPLHYGFHAWLIESIRPAK